MNHVLVAKVLRLSITWCKNRRKRWKRFWVSMGGSQTFSSIFSLRFFDETEEWIKFGKTVVEEVLAFLSRSLSNSFIRLSWPFFATVSIPLPLRPPIMAPPSAAIPRAGALTGAVAIKSPAQQTKIKINNFVGKKPTPTAYFPLPTDWQRQCLDWTDTKVVLALLRYVLVPWVVFSGVKGVCTGAMNRWVVSPVYHGWLKLKYFWLSMGSSIENMEWRALCESEWGNIFTYVCACVKNMWSTVQIFCLCIYCTLQ